MQSCLQPLEDQFRQARIAYVESFAQKAERIGRVSAITLEPIQRIEGNEMLRDNVLNLPVRSDVGILTGGALDHVVFAPSTPLRPAAAIELPEGVSMQAFTWDALAVRFDMIGGLSDMNRLRAWYLEWFLTRRISGEPEVSGCVHRMVGPMRDEGGWRMIIDMGTAPVEAALSLIDGLAVSGIRRLELGGEVKAAG